MQTLTNIKYKYYIFVLDLYLTRYKDDFVFICNVYHPNRDSIKDLIEIGFIGNVLCVTI